MRRAPSLLAAVLVSVLVTVLAVLDRPAAGEDAEPIPLEILRVPADGSAVKTLRPLAVEQLHLLRARGAVTVGGRALDAEFFAGADQVDGVDVGLDVGRPQLNRSVGYQPRPSGPGRMKWFGGARDDHTYYMIATGFGVPLEVRLARPGREAALGFIELALYRLSPAPPALPGAALEAVRVPLQPTVASTNLVTEPGRIYLLQASGAGRVGGGGLGLGDAEYMDWYADGVRANEGEAGVDFGIGVDEPRAAQPARGSGYPPRERWWGPFRRDHVYYMLFPGTGRPIQLGYHDTGYQDNGRSEALTVKIFRAP